VQAALLHDVLEDCDVTEKQLKQAFGDEVLFLVRGVTKLGQYRFRSKEEQNAENFRNMFLAMAQDVRVVTLKLADRLHNMRTLGHLSPEKQAKIAKETLDIFAPLANRMGIGNVRAELEDLSLKYLYPDAYQRIGDALASTQAQREAIIAQVRDKLGAHLTELGLEHRIYGRVKNYYSIYKKMTRQQKELDGIFDISALRIVVNTEKECYEALGVVHNAYTPVPGRFKDYIAMPKSNFYQSLHTTVFGPAGRPLEVQIRTAHMHDIAEYGIAAHFKYKEAGGSVAAKLTQEDKKLAWLRQMADMQNESGDARDFVESVKLDFFPDQVFVFTPKGEVINLPKGSTPVDLAFRVHTEVGYTCGGAIVNERMVQLDTELKNGDIVEIITNKKATPRMDWVNFVKTQHAKSRIRQWYKRHYRTQHEQQGKALLEAELTRAKVDKYLKEGHLLTVAKEKNYHSEADLFAALGYGEQSMSKVLSNLKRLSEPAADPSAEATPPTQAHHATQHRPHLGATTPTKPETEGQVTSLKGLVYHIARCCMPVPGDAIVGIVTRSRGVMVHQEGCSNTVNANPDRVMRLTWDGPVKMQKRKHMVTLEVQVLDRIGVLKDVLIEISALNVNVVTAKSRPMPDQPNLALIEVQVEVGSLDQLEVLVQRIKTVADVLSAKRQHYRMNKASASD
jgi:RelA/SpoT family (p)ppGpp synthetase